MVRLIKFLMISLVVLILCSSPVHSTGGNWNNPYMSMPSCGFCVINDSEYWWEYYAYNDIFSDPIPEVNWLPEYVNITAKGVLTCINVTVPANCTINVTFQWFNSSQYTSEWIAWRDSQDWSEGGIYVNWSAEPNPNNNSYWLDYYSWTGVNTSTQLCAYNINVTCSTENDYTNYLFYWRARAEIVCPLYTSNITCTYCFLPELCPVSSIYPPSPNGTACPCCDMMCVTVRNDLGHRMNFTIYGSEDNGNGCGNYHIWQIYTNVTNGTYCYCMDTITPSQKTHAVGHSHSGHTASATDVWQNISYDHGHGIRIGMNDIYNFTILEHGHYTITYWVSAMSEELNPNQDRLGIRLTNNEVEIDGSYRETVFSFKGADRDIMGQIHDEFEVGDRIRTQFIVDDLDSHVNQTGTWSDDNISYYIYIEKTCMEEFHPLKYNTTYYWYVNVTDTVTGEYNISHNFQFKTEPDPEDCFCGNVSALIDEECPQLYKAYIIGLLGLIGLAGLGLFKKKRRQG